MNTSNHTEYKWTHSPELLGALVKAKRKGFNIADELAALQKELETHRRLENEPKLYTKGQCIEFMQKAITLSRMGGRYTEKDLEDIIYNSK